jgi:cobalt-zinc-cadmium efflux system outer membrane protein
VAPALQAGKIPNPELDIRLYRLRATSPDPADDEDSRRRVILSQVFELGGKRGRRVDLAESEKDLAGWDYEAKRIEVATSVAVHFAAVLGAQRRVASWGRFVDFLDEMRDRATKLVETGVLRSVEVHEVRRQTGLARIELQTAEGELQMARLKLASMWDSRLPVFTEAVGDLEEVRPIPTVETVMEMAQRSPAIARFEAERALGQAALRLARSERVPDLAYGVGVRWDEVAGTRDYLVDFRISLPVFDRKQGDILEARHGLARIEAARKAAEALGRQEIADFYYPMVAADARRSTLAKEVLPAAGAAFEAQRLGIEIQAENLGDLIDARRDLANAEVQYAEALVDYHRALAGLEGIIGRSLGAAE